MFARIPLCFVLLSLVLPSQAQDSYRTYRNARFGTVVQYPANLLMAQPESDNGDGRRFLSRDQQIELTIFAFNNVKGRSSSGEMGRAIRDWRRDGANLTYQKAASDWFVLSGYVGDDIFYEKTLRRGTVFHSLIWQYPKGLRRRLDEPVTRSVRSFSAVATRQPASNSITLVPTATSSAVDAPPRPAPAPTATPRPVTRRFRASGRRSAPTRGY